MYINVSEFEKKIRFIKANILNIPDFPIKNIQFKDISTLFLNPSAFRTAIDLLIEMLSQNKIIDDIDVIISPEARGFVFGSILAFFFKKPFVMIRKQGKLPLKTRSVFSISYGTEYKKKNILEIHTDAFPKNKKILIVDDIIATWGTIDTCIKLVEKAGGTTVAVASLAYFSEFEKFISPKIKFISLIKY